MVINTLLETNETFCIFTSTCSFVIIMLIEAIFLCFIVWQLQEEAMNLLRNCMWVTFLAMQQSLISWRSLMVVLKLELYIMDVEAEGKH